VFKQLTNMRGRKRKKREHTAWVERVGACADAVCGYVLGGG